MSNIFPDLVQKPCAPLNRRQCIMNFNDRGLPADIKVGACSKKPKIVRFWQDSAGRLYKNKSDINTPPACDSNPVGSYYPNCRYAIGGTTVDYTACKNLGDKCLWRKDGIPPVVHEVWANSDVNLQTPYTPDKTAMYCRQSLCPVGSKCGERTSEDCAKWAQRECCNDQNAITTDKDALCGIG